MGLIKDCGVEVERSQPPIWGQAPPHSGSASGLEVTDGMSPENGMRGSRVRSRTGAKKDFSPRAATSWATTTTAPCDPSLISYEELMNLEFMVVVEKAKRPVQPQTSSLQPVWWETEIDPSRMIEGKASLVVTKHLPNSKAKYTVLIIQYFSQFLSVVQTRLLQLPPHYVVWKLKHDWWYGLGVIKASLLDNW